VDLNEMMQDPIFYGLVWAVFTVAGVIIGWTLRANYPEQALRNDLARTEQEKNTLARLYTHVKHQHDLREADFRRANIELSSLREQVLALENERSRDLASAKEYAPRLEKAEANATQYAQKVAALEVLASGLRARNQELGNQLERLQAELRAWQVLYDDFQAMQRKLAGLEQNALKLDQERAQLRQQLAFARIEIENLQLQLLQQQQNPSPNTRSNRRADQHGGPAAPENTDDLKIINGISPFAEQQLLSLGIHSFAQISRWDDDAIIAFAKALNISPGKIYQDDWVGQAQHLTSERLG
jgi:predicted flap endonuclease-1-like 5' DNA nuclease